MSHTAYYDLENRHFFLFPLCLCFLCKLHKSITWLYQDWLVFLLKKTIATTDLIAETQLPCKLPLKNWEFFREAVLHCAHEQAPQVLQLQPFLFFLKFSSLSFYFLFSSCLRCWWPCEICPCLYPQLSWSQTLSPLLPRQRETLLSLTATNFQKWYNFFLKFSKVYQNLDSSGSDLTGKVQRKQKKIQHMVIYKYCWRNLRNQRPMFILRVF